MSQRIWSIVILVGLMGAAGCSAMESALNDTVPGGSLTEKNYRYAPGQTPTEPPDSQRKDGKTAGRQAQQPAAQRYNSQSLDNSESFDDGDLSTNPISKVNPRDANSNLGQ